MAHVRSITLIMALVTALTSQLAIVSAQTNSAAGCTVICKQGQTTPKTACPAGMACRATGCIARLQYAELSGTCERTKQTTTIIERTEAFQLYEMETWCELTATTYGPTTTFGSYLRVTDAGACTIYSEGADTTFPRCSQSVWAILGKTSQGTQRVCCLRHCSGDPQPPLPAAPHAGSGPRLGVPIVIP